MIINIIVKSSCQGCINMIKWKELIEKRKGGVKMTYIGIIFSIIGILICLKALLKLK